jgi:hypothetical protein
MRAKGDGVPDFSRTPEIEEVTPRQSPLRVVGSRSGLPGGRGKVRGANLANEGLYWMNYALSRSI